MSKGIETYYAGRLFRSRLEAQWAAMFRLLGWDWIYEPFDAAGYIPDFAITGAYPLLVEIKPALTLDELEPPTARVMDALGTYGRDILFLGAGPVLPAASDGNCWSPDPGHVGLLAEFMDAPGDPFALGHALWVGCTYCDSAAVYHEEQSYACRPCGHHDGDSYLGAAPDVRAMWNLAGNKVRWEGQR